MTDETPSTADADAMYSDPEFALDLGDVEPLEAFSMEHWLYLAAKQLAPDVPTQLAPLPIPRRTGPMLETNLREWGLLKGFGPSAEIDSDLHYLLSELSVDYQCALWGSTQFPEHTHTRTMDLDPDAVEWGMSESMTVVPRVPFLATWSPGREVISAVSTENALHINRRPVQGRVTEDLADELWAILDPHSQWQARDMPTARLPRSVVDDLAADPVLGARTDQLQDRADNDPARRERDAALDRIINSHAGVGRDTRALADDLSGIATAAQAQAVATVRRQDGSFYTSEGVGVGLIFVREGTPGVICTHSPVDGYGDRVVVYESGTRKAVLDAVKDLFRDAVRERGWHAHTPVE